MQVKPVSRNKYIDDNKIESYTFDVDGMEGHGKITEDRESSWLMPEWLMTDDHIAD